MTIEKLARVEVEVKNVCGSDGCDGVRRGGDVTAEKLAEGERDNSMHKSEETKISQSVAEKEACSSGYTW